MYTVVAWDAWDADLEPRQEDELARAIMRALSDHEIVQVLRNFVFIRVEDAADVDKIDTVLTYVASKQFESKVRYIIGPPLPDDLWEGWLPLEEWEPINRITGGPAYAALGAGADEAAANEATSKEQVDLSEGRDE
jgi:hypothetical protein